MSVDAEESFDFKIEMDRLVLIGNLLVEDFPLDRLERAIEDAHAVGWFADPTKYRDALFSGTFDECVQIIKGAQEFAEAMRRVKAVHQVSP
ncbi:MAG: hypothetical protein WCF24_12375 [Acidimicrobiales bacterium]